MATKGTYTAYQQLRPLEGDISQDIQQQQENAFRLRQEKRIEDQIAQAKADKAAREKKDMWDKYAKPLFAADTGSKSLNSIQGTALQNATKEYLPLMTTLQDPNASDADKLKATLKLQNINALPEKMDNMTKAYTDRWIDYNKRVKEGKIRRNPDYEKNFQNGWDNFGIALSENGDPMVAVKNADGTTVLETYDAISKGQNPYTFEDIYDRDKELLEASQKLQPRTIVTNDGRIRRERTEIDPQLLKGYVNNQLFEADGVTPTAKLKSFATDAGVSYTDKKGLQNLADQFENDIRLRVKGGSKVEQVESDLEYAKEARQAAKDRKEEEKDKVTKTIGIFDDSMFKDDFTGKVLSRSSVRPNMITIGGENLKFSNLGGKQSTLNNGYITGFALDKAGNIIATGKALLNKGSKLKETDENTGEESSYQTPNNYGSFNRIVKGTELNDLITRAGYKNEKELKEELQGLNNSKSSSNGMVTMRLPDGRTGQIPEGNVSAFLKKYPTAKRL